MKIWITKQWDDLRDPGVVVLEVSDAQIGAWADGHGGLRLPASLFELWWRRSFLTIVTLAAGFASRYPIRPET